jgi:hypothetical protein
MRKFNIVERLDLRLFDAAPAAPAPAGSPPAATAAPAATSPTAEAPRRRSALTPIGKTTAERPIPTAAPKTEPAKSEPAALPEGKEAEKKSGAVVMTEPASTPDMDAEFENLISTKYKDQFAKRTQSIIDTRFKEAKGLEEQVKGAQSILEMQASKYGIKDFNPRDEKSLKALQSAIDEDSSFYEDAAMERGLTVAQYKDMLKIEHENKEYKEAEQSRLRKEHTDAKMTEWHKEATSLGVDLKAEADNPQTGKRFISLLSSPGIDVKTAYNAVHHDEIVSGALKQASVVTEKIVTENIRTRGMRPDEAAAAGGAPVTIPKADPSKMTRQQREDWAKDAARKSARGVNVGF